MEASYHGGEGDQSKEHINVGLMGRTLQMIHGGRRGNVSRGSLSHDSGQPLPKGQRPGGWCDEVNGGKLHDYVIQIPAQSGRLSIRLNCPPKSILAWRGGHQIGCRYLSRLLDKRDPMYGA